ncbi:hypothetical protein B5E84_10810 [Lachnoclostridium sp. An14]|uniref:hypothetical protein n=1 Tax=Lachnoclostridium sp. An14 TaxID=1965562 RepID=UPI000B3AC516|nr:hypothetical protein [Lachnoclostridium sp. An14]OUQ17233.1 hypothetical protein B5E84_10810 [Lachnoclostridium sp. An14]
MDTNHITADLPARIRDAERVLVGLGTEWGAGSGRDLKPAYEALAKLLEGKDYFIVTVNVDGQIYDSPLDGKRITAPCGNLHWYQCQAACTTDIWEEGEVADGKCPHCGAPLIPNTIEAEHYIEEGYLISWREYTAWLSRTLNRRLEVLELGAGVRMRELQVLRWPLEKTVFFNNKAHMYRINETFPQISDEIQTKAEAVKENSVEFVEKL